MPRSSQTDDDLLIAARVRSRRMLLGLSQTKLGRACGVSFQQIQKYEKGTNRISAGKLIKLAEALRCSPAYFYDAENDNVSDTVSELSRVDISIAQRVQGLSSPARSAVYNLIDALLRSEPKEANE